MKSQMIPAEALQPYLGNCQANAVRQLKRWPVLHVLFVWVLLLLCGVGAAKAQTSYNAVADFPAASNTSGTWRYGYYSYSSGVFVPYVNHSNSFPSGVTSWVDAPTAISPPFVAYNSNSATQLYYNVIHPRNLLNVHPGHNGSSGEKSVVRWVAPSPGTFTVQGRFEGLSLNGTTTDVAMCKGASMTTAVTSLQTLQSGYVSGHGADSQVSISLTIKVVAGNVIDFVVGNGGNDYGNDSTGLTVSITQQPNPITTGNGLWGEYYQVNASGSPSFIEDSGNLKFTRVDPQVDFNWGQGSPDSRLSNDGFEVRWTGTIKAPSTATYYFRTFADDGVRLWVDDMTTPIIDDWGPYHGTATDSVGVNFVLNRFYKIRLEYYENFGGAAVNLAWSSDGKQTFSTVPQSQLYCNGPDSLDVLNVKDSKFAGGAKGDGITDDTNAFLALTAEVNRRKGGVTVLIPSGTYMVGRQTGNSKNSDGNIYRYNGEDIMLFNNCVKPIIVQGSGAIMKHPDGMLFGGFDQNSKAVDSGEIAGTAAITGYMAGGSYCQQLTINGLELDGNNVNYVLGGNWGAKPSDGRQTRSYGLYLIGCASVSVDSVNSHNFGLDGLYIKSPDQNEKNAPLPHSFTNCSFQYNGRQGVSWSGGKGMTFTNCKMNHTGYAVNVPSKVLVSSAPGAGIDIEEEMGVCRQGQFVNCEFVHNIGPSMYAGAGLGKQLNETFELPTAAFRGCTFWNFHNYAVIPDYPSMSFMDCKIYGGTISAYQDGNSAHAPSFDSCQFEDKSHATFGSNTVDGTGAVLSSFLDAYQAVLSFQRPSMNGLKFTSCTVIDNQAAKALFLSLNNAQTTTGFSMNSCLVIVQKSGPPVADIGTLQGGVISDTHFVSGSPGPGTDSYFEQPCMDVVGNNVVMDPPMRWRYNGYQGTIPAAHYY